MRRTFNGLAQSFVIDRVPVVPSDPLFAFDAADELLVDYLRTHGHNVMAPWVLNDGFGTLSLALHAFQPRNHSDSALSYLGLDYNCAHNDVNPAEIRRCPPPNLPDEKPNLVVMRIPKSKALLNAQLRAIKPHLDVGTPVIAGAMTKHLRPYVVDSFERIIGSTRTTRAVKKARLIVSHAEHRSFEPTPRLEYVHAPTNLKFQAHAGVFSAGRLDQGTRFFVEHLPRPNGPCETIDLGCGDGIVGVLMGHQYPELKIHFRDVSFWAVHSAQKNWLTAQLEPERATFSVQDCLDDIGPNHANLILCNPPFHEGHTTGDHIAWRMFTQSARVLKEGGELRIVGNRHLGYHTKLKRLFGHCKMIASNHKFVILSAIKTSRSTGQKA